MPRTRQSKYIWGWERAVVLVHRRQTVTCGIHLSAISFCISYNLHPVILFGFYVHLHDFHAFFDDRYALSYLALAQALLTIGHGLLLTIILALIRHSLYTISTPFFHHVSPHGLLALISCLLRRACLTCIFVHFFPAVTPL